MTGVMTLDLNAQGDDLLVPFGRESSKDAVPVENHNPLYAPPPVHRQNPMRSFFRRRQLQTNEPKPEEEEEQKNVKKQQVTFKFPTAPQAFAEDEETEDPYKDNPAIDPTKTNQLKKKEETSKKQEDGSSDDSSPTKSNDLNKEETSKKQDDGSSEDSSSSSSSSSSDEDTEKKEIDRENRQQPPPRKTRDGLNAAPTSSFRALSFNELKEEWKKEEEKEAKRVPMEGLGNSKPEPDTPISAMSRMFRRIGRRSDMKSMKIATEDTKDERTFGETVTHVCQVALVPEVYADDMEGEGNLGFYRPVRSAPPRSTVPPAQQRLLNSVNKWKKENDQLLKKVVALRGHVEKLEEEMKLKDIETALWKLRAQELEEELRKYKDDDNSTTGPGKSSSGVGDESESGIDHEWKEESQEPSSPVKEEVLVDTTFVPKKITFDPLKSNEKDDVSEGLPDKKEEEISEREKSTCDPEGEVERKPAEAKQDATTAVKEEVLLDTNFVPEPVVFDPIQGSTEDEDAAGASVLDLIASLGADVEEKTDFSGVKVPG